MTARSARPSRKPKLGQNFLTDHGSARKIAEALGDVGAQTVVEIGPGRGIITDLLVPRAKRVIAIELDKVLAAQLRLRYSRFPNAEILEADILRVELPTVLSRPGPLRDLRPTQPEKVRIVGNLPYYITSDILLHLFEAHHLIESAVIMVQKEVADRIAANPGTREYGLLSATTQLYAKPRKLFSLPPGAFAPAPKVHSTVLHLEMKPRMEELGISEAGFISFLKLIFGQKRKTLLNNLRETYRGEAAQAAIKNAGLRSDVRAEAVSLEKTATLYRALTAVGVGAQRT